MVQTARVRRVRTRRIAVRPAASSRIRAMEEKLQSIANTMAEIDDLQMELQSLQAQLFMEMKEHKVPNIEIEKAVANVTRKMGKASNSIDPKKFFNAVAREDFFTAVSVSITKAKEVLSGKEYEKLVTHTPGKLGDEVLEIKLKKDGKRSH
jgi:uncharacterized protein YigA (DUF484 family)